MDAHGSFPIFYDNTLMDEEFLLENSIRSFNQQQTPQPILAPLPPSMFTPDSTGLLDHSLQMSPLPSLVDKQSDKVDRYLRLQVNLILFYI